MYLKSLHLRGFKSFADATLLDFEPGVTVIVGPNGSGKSNIVDALTWSMGTRSAKDLRGGQMADVIFAGAGQGKGARRAMGRAQVQITIDNADESLPIEFSEVTVGRAMFASGGNEYTINDVEVRQLDVAELLSDTGLGRETHTIVGQGRIDAVLNARPEERRAFIEEAAGILKHRRRKERALRKLKQMDGHLERLEDVLGEMKRQLRPLERQAEAAEKHLTLTTQLTEVRTERALRDLAVLLVRWSHMEEGREDAEERLANLGAALETHREEERRIGRGLSELSPAVRQATETQFALANMVERATGVVERIIERRNGLAEAADEPIAGRPPAELRGEADALQTTLAAVRERVTVTAGALEAAREATRTAEQARRAHAQEAAAEARRQVEARERRIRWEGEIGSLRSSLAQSASERGRIESNLQAQVDREAELEADVAAVNDTIQRLDSQAPALSERLTGLQQTRDKQKKVAAEIEATERELERRRASLEARADALFAASADPGEGAAALSEGAEAGEVDGLLGPLATLVQVDDGFAHALSAALGPLADALVVAGRGAAEQALGFVARRDAGRALLLVATAPNVEPDQPSLDAMGATSLASVVHGPPVGTAGVDEVGSRAVAAAVRRAVAGVYVCDDLDSAIGLADSRPELVFVTRTGELAGARGHAGGGAAAHSGVLNRAAAEEAKAQAEEVTKELGVVHRKVADADRELAAIRMDLEEAQGAMQECDNQITTAADRMGRLGKELNRCRSEKGQVERQMSQLATQIERAEARLTQMEDGGPEPYVPHEKFADGEGGDVEAERLDDLLSDAREAEVQARLTASTATQEAAELERRIDTLRREADTVEAQLTAREQRQQARQVAMRRCDELEAVAREVLSTGQASRIAAANERDRLEEARAEEQRKLGVVRQRVAEVERELAGAKDIRHAEELARQELRLQIDGVRTRMAEIGIDDAEERIAADRPRYLGEPDEDGHLPDRTIRDTELLETEEALVRKIGLLGTVNPLALEEFTALKERHAFMTDQLADLRKSKSDLLRVVDVVDGRIRQIFAQAFEDVAGHFEQIFPKLFPGGHGKLILTEPDDMLTTGVEVEARPPGKKVKRLSLLSGGERSLTALAVLFAIFAARPSPFYVLDEVEAALDDANLGRFLSVLDEFRGSSQWIIVTHQRRTMEIADMVYGVSMASDGVSKVISKKLSESGLARQ